VPSYKSGQQQAGELLPEGDYPFKIEAATLKTSSAGNEMIELRLRLPKGGVAFDNLVFTDSSSWKIDQFRVSIGELILPDEQVEVYPSELLQKTGWAHIVVDEYQGKKRNKVGSYLEPKEGDGLPGLD
jgi:hypothetical protein